MNDEWQRRMDQLVRQHAVEKDLLMKSHGDEKLNGPNETEELETQTETSEILCKPVEFEEQMQITLENLANNDRDRMEQMRNQCLEALELQSDLLTCTQVTEMMHMMTIEKRNFHSKMRSMRNEFDSVVSAKRSECKVSKQPSRDHPSKPIKHLWMELLKRLDDAEEETLDEGERKIRDGIHQLHAELMMEQKHQQPDESDELFIIYEPTGSINGADGDDGPGDETKLDWIYRKDDCVRVGSPFVEWAEVDGAAGKSPVNDGSFKSSVVARFSQPQQSMRQELSTAPKIASSIIKLVRESTDEKRLEESIIAMLSGNETMRKLSSVVQHAPAAKAFISMPKPGASIIKDSLEVLPKRVS